MRKVVKLCTLGVFPLRVSLVFMNCDDICMCVVSKQFQLLKLVFNSPYVDMQYDVSQFYRWVFVLVWCL